jgi:hypothetical protein
LSFSFVKARSTASKKFSINTVALEPSGRPSSFNRCNQPPLAIIDSDFIPLQYLSERLVHLGVAGSMLNRSEVNLGEAAVGLRSKLFTDVIQNILHVHRTVSFLWRMQRGVDVGRNRTQRFDEELLALLLRRERGKAAVTQLPLGERLTRWHPFQLTIPTLAVVGSPVCPENHGREIF